MSTLIKLRRDTAANWAAADPVLQLGEPGYDTTNNELRIGDGTTAWSGLTPIAGGGEAGLPLANGTSNFNIALASGNATVGVAGAYTWTFDTTGNLTVANAIIGLATIDIDNRATGNSADINLYSADDITIQARDRTLGSGSEGGDINIYAGDSAEDGDSSGGDIQIRAGDGGAGNVDYGGSGGFITIQSGRGGAAIGNTGATAESGGSLTLSAGDAGDNNGNIDLGADGGDVFIESGYSTGNTNNGGDIVLTTGTGGQNGASGNVQINIPGYGLTTGGNWRFNPNGSTIFPTLTITRGDRTGTLTGQALLFGDAGQEALISTPNGINDIPDSQRLVLNPGAGADGTTGEGGDIYLYAGRGGNVGGSGGDIKIRGGLGPVNGDGGYINIEGGEAEADGAGGYIEIFGGQSGNAAGGTLYIQGGYGRTGGDANVSGGFGATGPGGDVSIIGGGSANGQAEYGNVIVATGSKNWTFDNTGNLVLPSGTPSINYANGDPFSGGAVNTGNVTFDDNIVIGTGDEYGFSGLYLAIGAASAANLQYFRVRGGDVPTHLHFDTGNGAYYDQYFGDDGKFVKLEAGDFGNVSIGTQDLSNSYAWTFGNDGNLTLPGNASSINYADGSPFSGAPVNTGNLTFNQSTIETDQSNAYINFNAYSAGDIDVGTNDAKNVVIRTDGSNTNNAWTFDAVGNLTLPRGGVVYETNIPYGGLVGNTIALAPSGGTDADQQLLVYPTAGNIDANHLHLTTGNLYNTELFLGNDDLYVKLANTGNVVINSNDGVGNTAQWTFDALGNLTLPSEGAIQTSPGSGGNIFIHPNGNGAVIIQGGANTLLTLSSDQPDTTNRFEIDTYGDNLGSNGGGVFIGTYRRSSGATQQDDRLASYAAKGTVDGISVTGNTSARISLDASQNWSPGNTATHISFWTTPVGSSTVIEQMRLGPAGNLYVYNGGNLNLTGGNITGANVVIANAVSTTGNVTGGNLNTGGRVVATGNITGGNISATGTLTATGKIGYASGSTVTQTTNRGNGVTINALAGTIITTSAAMVATEIDTFSVLNSSVDPNNDIVLAQIVSPNQGTYNCIANPAVIGGFNNGFVLSIQNISGFTTSDETITIRFMVIKAPNA
jgi:hypothetical protein